MIISRKLLRSLSHGFVYSALIIIPLLLPLFILSLYQSGELERNKDFQVHITRDALEKDFSRFYPRKIFEIGIHIDDLSNINVSQKLFQSRFAFWGRNFFERSSNDRSIIGKNPFRLVNEDNLSLQPRTQRSLSETINEPLQFSDEELSQYVSYIAYNGSGSLKNEFYLSRYPFDVHTLNFIVEPRDFAAADMLLRVDPNSSLSGDISIGEWVIKNFTASSGIHISRTDYSDPKLIKKGALWHFTSRVVFQVKIKRRILSHLIKELLPLLVIMLMAYTNFYVDPSEFEARSSVSFTSFLSVTALHWVSSGEQTGVAYLTAMDQFFIVCYTLILLVIVDAVLSRAVLAADEKKKEQDKEKGIKKERRAHPWIRIGIPCLRVIYPVFLAGGWYWIAVKAISSQ